MNYQGIYYDEESIKQKILSEVINSLLNCTSIDTKKIIDSVLNFDNYIKLDNKEKFEDISPLNKELLLYYGLLCLEKAKYKYDGELCEKASDIFLHALDIDDSCFEAYYYLARSYYYSGMLFQDLDKKHYKSAESLKEKIEIHCKEYADNQYFLVYNNLLGDIYLKLNELEKAEIYYNKALEKDISNNYISARNGIGNIYREKSMFKEAVGQYKRVVEIVSQKEDDFIHAYNYLGDCYWRLEEYDKAIENYDNALSINSKFVFSIYGKGRVYYEKGNRNGGDEYYYESAKKFLEKAIKINRKFPYAWLDLARTLEKQGEYLEAIRYYIEAQYLFKDKFRKEEIRDSIERAFYHFDTKKKKDAINKDNSDKDPVLKVICKSSYTSWENSILKEQDKFDENFLRAEFRKNDDEGTYLETLRRWNSFTPMLSNDSKGGGYYLNIDGIGIVIDPGFSFVHNFISTNHKFADIDCVFITHSHNDHTADIEWIISLLYRYNEHLRKKVIRRDIAKALGLSIQDVEINDHGEIEAIKGYNIKQMNDYLDDNYSYKHRRRQIEFFISEGVYEKYKGIFDDSLNCCCRIDGPSEYDTNDKITKPETNYIFNVLKVNDVLKAPLRDGRKIDVHVMESFHEDKKGKGSSYKCLGFLFDLGKTIIVYTGDTGFNTELEKNYVDKMQILDKSKKIILLAHIGSFKEDERQYITNKNNKGCYYKNHLGRLGVARLVNTIKPELCIISEFGEEFLGHRVEVSNEFDSAFSELDDTSHKIKFLPADIGMKVDLNECTVNAIVEIDVYKKRIIYDYIDSKHVKVGEYVKQNSLYYYYDRLEEAQCVKAIYEDYKKIQR